MRTAILAAAAWFLAPAATADAQEWRSRRERPRVTDEAGVFPYDGRLTFARIRFEPRNVWGRGWGMPPWAHDYPTAERNFMTILSEITTARPYTGGSRIVTLDDPELFRYPVAYMSEPGHWTLSEAEADGLRRYFEKGGFVIFDDFSGNDWHNFEAMMGRVIPGVRILPLTIDHPVFHAFFEIETLELRHPNYGGYTAEFYGVFEDNDPDGRLLAVVNYNTDIGDYFEYSATGFLPVDLSNQAYKLGVNYWVYALTR